MFHRLSLLLVLLVGLLLVGLSGSYLWRSWSLVSGTEICPDTFRLQTFKYYRSVFFRRGFWKTESITDEFQLALELTGALPAQPPRRWDPVSHNRSSRLDQGLRARMLADIVYQRNMERRFFWIQWTEDHLEQAKILWPLVRDLAVDDFYVIIPVLFETALIWQDLEPSELDRRLRTAVVQELHDLRQESLAVGRLADLPRLDEAMARYQPG